MCIMKFTQALIQENPKGMEWLCFLLAREVLPCWEDLCDDTTPRKLVFLLAEYFLADNREIVSLELSKIVSPHKDCWQCDTQAAADAIIAAAKFIQNKNTLDAIYCLSDADSAIDQSHVPVDYRPWLINTAIPLAVALAENKGIATQQICLDELKPKVNATQKILNWLGLRWK